MRLRQALLAGSVALMTAAGPALCAKEKAAPPPPCPCDILAACPWFTVAWQDTCPGTSSKGFAAEFGQMQKQQLLERMAHGVAFASAAWHLVQNNPDLAARLEAEPITLVHFRTGKVHRADDRAEPDSVLKRFQHADKSSVAKLYTIRLGSYGSVQAAQSAIPQWKLLQEESGDGPEAYPDSLLAVSWKYESCAGARTPGLFILPPSVSSSGRFDLDFRLVIDEADAKRIATSLQQKSLAHVEVATVQVDAGVLAVVLSQ
jgi:hypothetical protein